MGLRKRPIYAEAGVKHFWWIEPLPELLEVYKAVNKRWTLVGAYAGNTRARAEPFADAAINLSRLWAGIPKRASEPNESIYAP